MQTCLTQSIEEATFLDADFMPVDLEVHTANDGSIILRSRVALSEHDPNFARALAKKLIDHGDTLALAWRGVDGEWKKINYRDVKNRIDSVAAWFRRELQPRSAILIIGENSYAAAITTFAAHAANMIAAPVGPMVALIGPPFERLRHIVDKLKPAVVLLECGPPSAEAAAMLREHGVRIVSTDHEGIGGEVIPFDDLLVESVQPGADQLLDMLDADAPAQYMLTSGSTGLPKVVPHSLRMMAANVTQSHDAIGRVIHWDDDMLEWGPWHHAVGASILRACWFFGGTYYVDSGKPLPGLFEQSLANIREIPLNQMYNGPSGFAMLVEELETDPELRATFFKKMQILLYGGSVLSQQLYDRIQAAAIAQTGRKIHCASGYGMTETVAACFYIHWPDDKVGIGLPAPGVTVKLVPQGDLYEVRLKGPNVMPAYLDEPRHNETAFDDEGFFITGDLAVFQDPGNASSGLAFAGRQSEEFKLANATWVRGGTLRVSLLNALKGKVSDLVLADDGWPFLGMLAWATPGTSLDEIAEAVQHFNVSQHGASSRVARLALLDRPPDPSKNELTDKGTVIRRSILDNRRHEIARLLDPAPDAGIRILLK